MPHLGDQSLDCVIENIKAINDSTIQYSMVDSLILLDARREVGVIGGVIRVSQAGRVRGGCGRREKLEPQGAQRKP